jgi:hypothetical protein
MKRKNKRSRKARTMDAKNLLSDYEYGVGFNRGDILEPRLGANPFPARECINRTVVVLSQSTLAPHQYIIIAERPSPRSPSDRFLKTEINGHDWKKVGHAK